MYSWVSVYTLSNEYTRTVSSQLTDWLPFACWSVGLPVSNYYYHNTLYSHYYHHDYIIVIIKSINFSIIAIIMSCMVFDIILIIIISIVLSLLSLL